MRNNSNRYPFVSVVIPVLNDGRELERILCRLHEQTYPDNRYEIIVIDNGSSDNTIDVVRNHPRAVLLFEHTHKNSPYSARNRGIEKAIGEIIAFLDATCEPTRDWLMRGIEMFKNNDTELVGGNVQFRLNGTPSLTNIYEKLMTLRVKDSILQNNATVTANLFVYKWIIEDIGMFQEGIRSGGDIMWTKEATLKGYKLKYSEDALVLKRPRSRKEFLLKMWRFGKARPQRWQKENIKVSVVKLFLNAFRPPKLRRLREIISQRGEVYMEAYVIRLWMYHYVVRIIQHMGNIYGYMLIKSNKTTIK
jgi:glycosyltransferase AglE